MAIARVLVTGPVEQLDEWCAAARSVGWQPIAWPLIEIEELAAEESLARSIAANLPEHLVLASAHAVPFVEGLALHAPALRALPCSLVGQRSVGLLRSLGFTGEIEWHANAEALLEELRARSPRPARVLWPRGDRSDELGRALRVAGIAVQDPLAYLNRPRDPSQRPPAAELVFFASPSGVRAWTDVCGAYPAQRAMAIGPTTHEALLAEKTLPFFDIISLPEPLSSSFAAALQHLDLRSTP